MVKSDADALGTVVAFKPNKAQRRLMARLWNRNIILKARQLGFTTLVAILWLDHALFNADQRCGIIAQDREAAEAIFRDKVKLAYERLPAPIRIRGLWAAWLAHAVGELTAASGRPRASAPYAGKPGA